MCIPGGKRQSVACPTARNMAADRCRGQPSLRFGMPRSLSPRAVPYFTFSGALIPSCALNSGGTISRKCPRGRRRMPPGALYHLPSFYIIALFSSSSTWGGFTPSEFLNKPWSHGIFASTPRAVYCTSYMSDEGRDVSLHTLSRYMGTETPITALRGYVHLVLHPS